MSHICETCSAPFKVPSGGASTDAGDWCAQCLAKWALESALAAGIPLSVIEGRTKLTDHFSTDYINAQCGRSVSDEGEGDGEVSNGTK